jgi:SH3-like domain-containing protein
VLEIAYVAVPQAILRDHVSAVFNKTGVVKNGQRLEVLDRERRFVKVRSADGAEGWIEQRFLTSDMVYQGFQKLAQQEAGDPVQATGTTRNETNLHLTPGRETDHLYLLSQASKVTILKRATVDKNAAPVPSLQPKPAPAAKPTKGGAPASIKATAPQSPNTDLVVESQSVQPQKQKPIPAVMEDWYLILDQQGRVGWVLARMVDLDVPLEIAQYAEGQRLIAFFVLNQVTDKNKGEEKKVPQYLVLFTEPKDGLPYDYDQIRVFTWNTHRHRYETAYRERKLNGYLPVTVSQEAFDKEGTLPVFMLRVKDDAGNLLERKYKLNTPIVRRVTAAGEEKETMKQHH